MSPDAAAREAWTPESLCATVRGAAAVRSLHAAAGEQPPRSATRESPRAAAKTRSAKQTSKHPERENVPMYVAGVYT